MILSRTFFSKISPWQAFWAQRRLKKIAGDKLFKTFKLHKTEWPSSLYFYSPRLKRRPVFVGDSQKLSQWKAAKMCETICPTHAIKVTADAIIIDDRGCIGCGLCIEFAPEGLLEMSSDSSAFHRVE